MIKNTHSNGFAHAVLIIGLVVALIGALGFVFWQNFIHEEPVRTELLETEVSSKEVPVDSSSEEDEMSEDSNEATALNVQYINGVSFTLSKDFGNIASWDLTSENVNVSSDTLLAKEKKLYGDKELYCQARDYPLGRISVTENSTPYPGYSIIKKLESGKYLSYADESEDSFCFSKRGKLRETITAQVSEIKSALKDAE